MLHIYYNEKQSKMPKKMLKGDYLYLIESHFATQGQKLTNLSKATIPKLKEIIAKYKIKYDEEEIISANDTKKVMQKKEKEEEEIKHNKLMKERRERSEFWENLTEEQREEVVMYLLIQRHKNYLDNYWKNKMENKKLVEEVDKMEAKFKEEVGEDKVERKGKNHLCIKGVNLDCGVYNDEWNEEQELKNCEKITDVNHISDRINIKMILEKIIEEKK